MVSNTEQPENSEDDLIDEQNNDEEYVDQNWPENDNDDYIIEPGDN